MICILTYPPSAGYTKNEFPQLCHLLPILPNVRYMKNEISSIMSSITYPTKR